MPGTIEENSKKEPSRLLERELADRWRMSQRTLQRWRYQGRGVAFLRIQKRIVYAVEDVEAYEAAARVGGGALK